MTVDRDAGGEDVLEAVELPRFPTFFIVQATSIVADMNGTLWKFDLTAGTVSLVAVLADIADGGRAAH